MIVLPPYRIVATVASSERGDITAFAMHESDAMPIASALVGRPGVVTVKVWRRQNGADEVLVDTFSPMPPLPRIDPAMLPY